MLDCYNDARSANDKLTFNSWHNGQLKRIARNAQLDHPSLPPVPDEDLDDGSAVPAKLVPKPSPKPSAVALAIPTDDDMQTDDRTLVPA